MGSLVVFQCIESVLHCPFCSQHTENFGAYQDDNLFQDEMRYLRSTSVPAPYISVTPDACPNVFEEQGSNMKSMPPRYCNKLPIFESAVFW